MTKGVPAPGRDSAASDGPSLTLIFTNATDRPVTFVCFQGWPGGLPEGCQTLAWFAQLADSSSKVYYPWTVTYDLIWSEVGELTVGAIFEASQTLAADPEGANAATLTTSNGALTFSAGSPFPQPPSGSLLINQDGSIPSGAASIGVGMAGYGTFAVPSRENAKVAFTPNPVYYIAHGEGISRGEVIDASKLSAVEAIAFPSNMFAAEATLVSDDKWTITYAPEPPEEPGRDGAPGLERST
jgi:hypothetical protein